MGNDNAYIEPQHVLAALLGQADGSTRSLLQRAGVNLPRVQTSLQEEIDRLPKVEGSNQVQLGRDATGLLNQADKAAQKRSDQFIASEMFLLALADDKGETGRLLKEAGLTKSALESAH